MVEDVKNNDDVPLAELSILDKIALIDKKDALMNEDTENRDIIEDNIANLEKDVDDFAVKLILVYKALAKKDDDLYDAVNDYIESLLKSEGDSWVRYIMILREKLLYTARIALIFSKDYDDKPENTNSVMNWVNNFIKLFVTLLFALFVAVFVSSYSNEELLGWFVGILLIIVFLPKDIKKSFKNW